MSARDSKIVCAPVVRIVAGLLIVFAAAQISQGKDSPAKPAGGKAPMPVSKADPDENRTGAAAPKRAEERENNPIKVTVTQFAEEYSKDRKAFDAKYLGRVVHVRGTVQSFRAFHYFGKVWIKGDDNRIVACRYRRIGNVYPRWAGLAVGQEVVVAGRVRHEANLDRVIADATLIEVGKDKAKLMTAAEWTKKYEADPEAVVKEEANNQTFQITAEVIDIAEDYMVIGDHPKWKPQFFTVMRLKGHAREFGDTAIVNCVWHPGVGLAPRTATGEIVKIGDQVLLRAELSRTGTPLRNPRILKKTRPSADAKGADERQDDPIEVAIAQFRAELSQDPKAWEAKYMGRAVQLRAKVRCLDPADPRRIWIQGDKQETALCDFREKRREYHRWLALAAGQEVVIAGWVRRDSKFSNYTPFVLSEPQLIEVGKDKANFVSAAELSKEFEANPKATFKKYGWFQTFQVTGEVVDISQKQVEIGRGGSVGPRRVRILEMHLEGHIRDSGEAAIVKCIWDYSGPDPKIMPLVVNKEMVKIGDHVVIRAELNGPNTIPLELHRVRILNKKRPAADK